MSSTLLTNHYYCMVRPSSTHIPLSPKSKLISYQRVVKRSFPIHHYVVNTILSATLLIFYELDLSLIQRKIRKIALTQVKTMEYLETHHQVLVAHVIQRQNLAMHLFLSRIQAKSKNFYPIMVAHAKLPRILAKPKMIHGEMVKLMCMETKKSSIITIGNKSNMSLLRNNFSFSCFSTVCTYISTMLCHVIASLVQFRAGKVDTCA